jgi:Flp pilus assembly protein TadB
MTILEKLTLVYTANTYIYTTNQTAAQVQANIEFVLNQKEIFDFQFNLTGTLNKDNTFQLVRRMGLVTITRAGKPLIINGRFFENEDKKANIEMETKPHFIFSISTCFCMLGGIISLLFSHFIGVFFALIIIAILWINSYLTHKYYKSEFEKALDLWCEDVPVMRRFEY